MERIRGIFGAAAGDKLMRQRAHIGDAQDGRGQACRGQRDPAPLEQRRVEGVARQSVRVEQVLELGNAGGQLVVEAKEHDELEQQRWERKKTYKPQSSTHVYQNCPPEAQLATQTNTCSSTQVMSEAPKIVNAHPSWPNGWLELYIHTW